MKTRFRHSRAVCAPAMHESDKKKKLPTAASMLEDCTSPDTQLSIHYSLQSHLKCDFIKRLPSLSSSSSSFSARNSNEHSLAVAVVLKFILHCFFIKICLLPAAVAASLQLCLLLNELTSLRQLNS